MQAEKTKMDAERESSGGASVSHRSDGSSTGGRAEDILVGYHADGRGRVRFSGYQDRTDIVGTEVEKAKVDAKEEFS